VEIVKANVAISQLAKYMQAGHNTTNVKTVLFKLTVLSFAAGGLTLRRAFFKLNLPVCAIN
jgi:hypothetical protein